MLARGPRQKRKAQLISWSRKQMKNGSKSENCFRMSDRLWKIDRQFCKKLYIVYLWRFCQRMAEASFHFNILVISKHKIVTRVLKLTFTLAPCVFLYSGREPKFEQPEFTRELFSIAKNCLLNASSFGRKIGGLYLIYGLYFNQKTKYSITNQS